MPGWRHANAPPQDLDAFASMSDRELRDIGMNRASTNFVALGGRIRDYPF